MTSDLLVKMREAGFLRSEPSRWIRPWKNTHGILLERSETEEGCSVTMLMPARVVTFRGSKLRLKGEVVSGDHVDLLGVDDGVISLAPVRKATIEQRVLTAKMADEA